MPKIGKIDAKKTQQYQKRLFAVSEILSDRNWFYFSFSVESSRFIFNNFITVKLKLTIRG